MTVTHDGPGPASRNSTDETDEKGASVSTKSSGLNEADVADDATAVPREVLGDVYTALAARRTTFDTLMWQIPTIGLAAQAFLLTIALGAGSSRWARMVAGSLALVTALVAMQTMAKHRANERTDSLILERLEERLRIRVSGVSPHARPADRATAVGNRLRGWLGLRSFDLWIGSLLLFALAGGIAVVLAAISPHVFD